MEVELKSQQWLRNKLQSFVDSISRYCGVEDAKKRGFFEGSLFRPFCFLFVGTQRQKPYGLNLSKKKKDERKNKNESKKPNKIQYCELPLI